MPSETHTPAWTDDDLSANPHANADKAKRVERMFASIAHAYDLNNRLHSMWRDQAWRRTAVKLAGVNAFEQVVDVACGTGDLALAFSKHQVGQSQDALPVVGIDFTHEMLQIARMKTRRRYSVQGGGPGQGDDFVRWIRGDAMNLPLPDRCCDVVSIAFGIRNVADPAAAMREFYRVLRSGGRVIILEFSTPTNPVIRFFDRVYRERVMPITASLIARDKSGAYKYLPKSVSTFTDRAGMVESMRAVGFTDPTIKPLTFGVAVCYRGVKP